MVVRVFMRVVFVFFKQRTAYEMRISDWSSDVCSSDLALLGLTTAVPIPAPAAAPIDFWNVPRHGGNSFNGTPPDQAYFDALAGYGATWVRLVYDKWTPARRDFLIGEIGRAHV